MQLEFHFRETWLHRVNPSFKLLFSVALFIFILFVHNLNVLTYITTVALLLLATSTGHPRHRLLLYIVPFLFIAVSTSTSMIFFGKGHTTWFQWGLVHITEESFFRGLHIGIRAFNFALLGLLFALTTRPVYLFYSLMQQLRLPPRYAYSFMAAIRLIPMMLEEFQTLRYALKVRGIHGQKGWNGFYRKLKAYSVPLLAQSIRKAQRIAVAMEAKRFDKSGGRRTYFYHLHCSRLDAAFALYFIVGWGLAWLAGIYFPFAELTDVRHLD